MVTKFNAKIRFKNGNMEESEFAGPMPTNTRALVVGFAKRKFHGFKEQAGEHEVVFHISCRYTEGPARFEFSARIVNVELIGRMDDDS